MRLGTEVVYFGRADIRDDVDEVGRVCEVTVVQLELRRAWRCMREASVRKEKVC